MKKQTKVQHSLKYLLRFLYADGVDMLPHAIIFSISALYFFQVMIITAVFSYLPKFVKSLGIPETKTAQVSGLVTASLNIGGIISSGISGWLSDSKYRKQGLLAISAGQVLSTLMFGMSQTITWSTVTRFMQGFFMCIVVILAVLITEHSNDTNLSLAMSIFYASYNMGSVLGPSLSGFLVFPAEQYPITFRHDSFFGTYSIMLPNLVIAFGVAVSAIATVFVLPSERLKSGKELSLISSRILNDRELSLSSQNLNHLLIEFDHDSDLFHTKMYLKDICGFTFLRKIINVVRSSKVVEVLACKESLACVILRLLYSMLSVGYWEIIAVYVATAKNYGGLGMNPSKIGLVWFIFNMLAVFGLFVVVPKTISKYGAKKAFLTWVLLFGIISPFIPAIALVSNAKIQISLFIFLQAVIETLNTGCFVSGIMFSKNAVKRDLIGTIYGLGLCASSIGKIIGAAGLSSIYSWSLSNIEISKTGFPFNQYFVFLVVSFICVCNAAHVKYFIPQSLDRELK